MKKILPFIKEDIEEKGDVGIIRGYGSTFGGDPDSYGDIIKQGAFSESIKANGRGGLGFAMLWQHYADEPMGVWASIVEDSKGLALEGNVEIKSDIGRHRFELLKMGGVKGLSIGFDMPRDDKGRVLDTAIERNAKERTQLLKTINLWEISPVTFAANTNAQITGIKSLEGAKTERELENALRESGLSKSEALYVAKLCRQGLRESGTKSDDIGEIISCIQGTMVKLDTTNNPENELYEALKHVNNMLA